MKTNLTLLLLLVMMVSCQPKKSDSIEMSVAEAAKIDNIEDCTVDTVKATAIFWIDKVETKHCKEYGFVFPSSDIYDGLGAVYDYGQMGVELKNNIKNRLM